MRVVQLDELGYPHYFLYEDGRLYNTSTNEWRIPQKGNEYVLWNVEKTIKTRVNSKHLLAWCFDSPNSLQYCNYRFMTDLGFSKYIITNIGDVFSMVTFTWLTHNLSFDGYHRVYIIDDTGHGRTMVVSRLVALTFIPNPENKPEVNHIDGNKNNNCVSNLEWVYGWENVQHAREHALRKSVMSDETIHEVCRRLEAGERVIDIMHALNLPKHAIMSIKSGVHRRISQNYNIPLNKHF